MNWDRIQGEWKQLASSVKTKWAKLTDDDIHLIGAKKDALVGKIQERYGVLRDEAEKQVDEWVAKLPSRRDAGAPPGRSDDRGASGMGSTKH
jgi:uncharacterized protein YjbJ (UPF0337 family)